MPLNLTGLLEQVKEDKMKITNIAEYNLIRCDADEGKVIDWAKPVYNDIYGEDGSVVGQAQAHLYAKTIFTGVNNDISIYVEVEAPEV